MSRKKNRRTGNSEKNQKIADPSQSASELVHQNTGEIIRNEISATSGPIPPPEMIRQYNEIVPGSAERFIIMSEKEQNHRFDMDSKTHNSFTKITISGQWMGLVVSLSGLITASVMAYFGLALGAPLIASISLAGLAMLPAVKESFRKFYTREKNTKQV